MRKGLVSIAVLVVVVSLFLFLKRSDSPAPVVEPTADHAIASGDSSTKTDSGAARPRWTKPARNEVPQEDASTPSKAIVYSATDFARGELQNIVVDDGIRLGNNAAFVPRFNPKFRLFGNFISPETDATEPFDALSLNLQASALGENEVLFEVRTRSRFNEWSEWREVSPQNMKEPIAAEAPKSTGWQFRITLFANDATGSPKVDTVSIEPMAASAQNLSANNDNTK